MTEQPPEATPTSIAGGYWTIAVLALIVVAAFAGLAAIDRSERYAAAERERAVVIGLATRAADNTIDRYDRLLGRIAQAAATDGAADSLIAAAPDLDPDLVAIAVLDADGAAAGPPARIAPAIFDAITADAMARARIPGIHATAAIRDPGLGIDLIGLARMRRGADGAFGGAVVAIVDAASLVPLDRLPPLPPGSRLTILWRDGTSLFQQAAAAPPAAEPATTAAGPASTPLSPLTVRYQRAQGEIAAAWRAAWLRNGIVVGSVGLLAALAAAGADWRRRRAALRTAARHARKALELQQNVAELAAAKTRADEASRAKSLFFAQVTHELRTPLNAILGFSEAIKRQMFGPIANPRYVDYSGLIHDAGSHLLSLINDLLDLSKLEEGRMEIAPIRVSAAALARSTFDLVELLARERNQTLVLSGIEGCRDLHVDPRAAKQVLVNLLSNAIKFTPPGGRIDVRFASRGDGAVVITVADSGIGMRPEDISLAFEPFGRAGGELSKRTPGTGLGLPIARALMRLHGGDLTLISRPGHGTAATAVFPAEATIGTLRTLATVPPVETAAEGQPKAEAA